MSGFLLQMDTLFSFCCTIHLFSALTHLISHLFQFR
jgi:hypothetical protein